MQALSGSVRWWFESIDQVRRMRGAAMDRIGLCANESPYESVTSRPGMQLRFYGGKDKKAPVLLIIPAPIKRSYIWDITPDRSVVRHALDEGFQVYLVDWAAADDEDINYGLDEYGHTLIDSCIDIIHSRHPTNKVFFASHSLGGVFATIYAAMRPERVAGLVMIESPLHFASATGSFYPYLRFAPSAAQIASMFDRVPGSVLNFVSVAASPTTFSTERYADLVASMDQPTAMHTHMLVERWALDEAPMSSKLFGQVVEQLYHQDQFLNTQLVINNQKIGPAKVIAPMLSVYDPHSLIIPPKSITVFHDAAGSPIKRLIPYLGDIGVALAHVGALVGYNAHHQVWPKIFKWMNVIGAESH